MKTPDQLADAVLARIGDAAEAEVHVSGGRSSLTRFANSFIHQNVAEEGATVSVRLAVEGRVAAGSTTNLTDAGLDRLVTETIDLASLRPVDEDWPGIVAPAAVPDLEHFDAETAEATPATRAAVVKDFVDAGQGLRAAGYCETQAPEVVFANTKGHRVRGRYSLATLDGIHQAETSAGSGHATSSRLSDIDGSEVGGLAARRALDGIAPYDVKPGEYEVVLSPECVATIAMFIGYYGLNAKAHQEGQSFARLGEQQFDGDFNLTDDVTDARALGVPFDFEGTPKHRVAMIQDGVTRSLAHDLRTARRAGVESTGHALPGSDVWGPLPTTVFIGEGKESVESMISAVDRGLYVSTFNYCRVLDPKSLAVTGLTRNGTFMIENGRITGAVTNLRFTQSFVAALGEGRILGIGDDARHADSEFGPGIIHAPSMRLAGWHFTGGAAG
jgi:predicted Zn-dependent protease